MNLKALIQDYTEYLKYEQLASSETIKVRLSNLGQFQKYMELEKKIADIQEIKLNHLRAYISHKRIEAGCQPLTICNIINSLRAFYNFTVKKNFISQNVAQKLKKPHVNCNEVEHFTWEEIEKILLTVPKKKYYLRNICILLMLYYCGLRLDEIANIRVNNISFDFCELHVEKAKGDKPRLLPIHPFLQRVLKVYLKVRQDNKSEWLFTGRSDKALGKGGISKIVKECCKVIPEKRGSPHTFRHSYATHLHEKGVDIFRIAQCLGHVNIDKTSIYTHAGNEELFKEVKKLS